MPGPPDFLPNPPDCADQQFPNHPPARIISQINQDLSDFPVQKLASLVDKYSNGDGMHPTRIPSLECIRMSEPDVRTPWVYQPSLCLIVQGEKRVSLNNENFVYAPSQYLAITVDLPAIGTITQARREAPYLSLKIDIDVGVISALIAR